jgi:hypothetical protein
MAVYTTTTKVANIARNIEINTGRASTLTPTQATDFLDWADDVINSRLSALYYTPLRQITRTGVTRYPAPIEHIASNLAAGYMVESIYSRIDPQVSDAGKAHKENALMELDEICNGILTGSRRIEGQTTKARNSFANPNVIPLEPPKERRI